MKKRYFLFLFIFLCICRTYDAGYEAAWSGESLPLICISQEASDGYEQGLDDVWMLDEGYDDAYNHRKPKYKNDDFYMEGYKEGKMDR